ncbi:MAG: xylB [Acidimicrobiaceae bacterium]|nr:xylB [Acidimicrobiaceae bacterium]
MALVAGIDSSTQSCKVVVRDAETGALLREGRAPHPDGTEVDPTAWWAALTSAVEQAGGLDDVDALAVGAQQHGMVALDEEGRVIRPALLWNDTRSARAAAELVDELGLGDTGALAWAEAVGTVPVASFTVTKLRWLAENEPENAKRVAAVCLPHDWLTWRLGGHGPSFPGSDDWAMPPGRSGSVRGSLPGAAGGGLNALTTDRGDASGTGYWSPATGAYRLDLLERALGHLAVLPRVLRPTESPGEALAGGRLGPGTGDNAAAALGVGLGPGDVVVSIGTSGTVFAVSERATADPSGLVAGFADATGRYLPLACTLNAARVLDAACALLGVDHATLDRLALRAPAGADGLVVVPYLEGERTPNRPESTGAIHGLRLSTSTPTHLARAAVEGLLCGLADGLDALVAQGVTIERIVLVGGGSRSEAVQHIAPAVLGYPVTVAPEGEYVADGAARQAAWTLSRAQEPPRWAHDGVGATFEAPATPWVRERYGEVRELTASRPGA